MGSYCLIVEDQLTNPEKIVSFMTASMGLDAPEAELRLSASPGFILENAAFEAAMSARALAAGAGLKTLVVESRDLSALPSPFIIEKIVFRSDGFIFNDGFQRGFAAYGGLTLLAAAAIRTEAPPIAPVRREGGLLYEIRRKILPDTAKPVAPATPIRDFIFYADIFGAQEISPRLRLRHDQFDFSGLGAAKTYASADNFRLLLDKLQARSFSKPFVNRAFSGIIKKIPSGKFALRGLEAYEKELAWLVCAGKASKPPTGGLS